MPAPGRARTSPAPGASAPSRSSAASPPGRTRARRRLRCAPPSASGGSTACSRTPPGRTPSTHGWASSSRRPGRPRQTHRQRAELVGEHLDHAAFDAAATVDPHRAVTVDEDVGDLGVGRQRRQRPEADEPGGEVGSRSRAALVAEGRGVLRGDGADRGGVGRSARPDGALDGRSQWPGRRRHDAASSESTTSTTASAARRMASRPVPGHSPRSASRATRGSSGRWQR